MMDSSVYATRRLTRNQSVRVGVPRRYAGAASVCRLKTADTVISKLTVRLAFQPIGLRVKFVLFGL